VKRCRRKEEEKDDVECAVWNQIDKLLRNYCGEMMMMLLRENE
jgi:hypothetical protein